MKAITVTGTRWFAKVAIATSLALALFGAVSALAGPDFGKYKKDSAESAAEGTVKLFTPDAYHNIPAGRSGGTIGLAIMPRLNKDSDDAERSIAEVVGHLPAINMAILPPENDPMYLFKFLKHLKSTGKKVDVLFIGGHGLQAIQNDEIFAIKLGPNSKLTPAAVDVVGLQAELEKLAASGSDPAKKTQVCEKLKLIRDGSSALVPGAQLILHSCYLGSSDGRPFMQKLGTAFLGVNGGTVVGPLQPIGSKIIAANEPHGVINTTIQTLVTRSVQICQSLKARQYLRPGDAFISTNQYFQSNVPAGKLKLPCDCEDFPRRFVSGSYEVNVIGNLQPNVAPNAPFYRVEGTGPFGNLVGHFFGGACKDCLLVTACDGCKVTSLDAGAVSGRLPAGGKTMTLKWTNLKTHTPESLDYEVAD